MKLDNLHYFLILFTLVTVSYLVFEKSERSAGNSKIDSVEVYSVLETYSKKEQLNGKIIKVTGYLRSIEGILYLVDVSGDKKIHISKRVFVLDENSSSNILTLTGRYEISGEATIDNFLTDLVLIEII